MATYTQVANDQTIQNVVQALDANNVDTVVAEDNEAAKEAVLKLIPSGAKVFTGTSETLRTLGLEEVLNSEPYESVRANFMKLAEQPDKALEMKQIGSAADVYAGSAHALTEDGKILIASASGSQMPAISYGAAKVVLVVSAQKIVKDLVAGIQRIEQHVVPLEDKRAQEAYGINTNFSKLLVLNNGATRGRVHVVIVKQNLGF